jgi:hypothetical protein
MNQSLIDSAPDRVWRTDLNRGRNIYVVLSNDPAKTSPHDPLIGTMESSALAETVVEVHNSLVSKFGKRYLNILENL